MYEDTSLGFLWMKLRYTHNKPPFTRGQASPKIDAYAPLDEKREINPFLMPLLVLKYRIVKTPLQLLQPAATDCQLSIHASCEVRVVSGN